MTIELTSLAELSEVLMADTARVLERVHAGLGTSAQLLEDTAKAEFGEYQPAAGPFAAWPELADATKADRVAKSFPANEPLLRTGELRDSIVHDVGEWEATVGSTSPLMPYHEFGTLHMPPRPVLGSALQRAWPMIQQIMGQAAASGISGGYAQTPIGETASQLDTPGSAPPGYDL